MNFNKVIIGGNVTRDPQLSYLPSGTACAEFGIAVNRKWTTGEGQKRDEVCFVDVKAFGKTAETVNQYFAKGKPILVEGRLKLDTWEAKEGGKRSKLYVILESFSFAGGDRNQAEQARDQQTEPEYAAQSGDDAPF